MKGKSLSRAEDAPVPRALLMGVPFQERHFLPQFSSVSQPCPLSVTPWTAARQASLYQLPELAQTQIHQVSDTIQPSHPLSSPSPPDFNLSQHQGLFQAVSSSHQVAKYWHFSFSISPSNEYSGLISFRIDWLDLLAVHRTLKSLLQH